ncbi:hypothetical protein L9H26_18905 [Morganella psychrotolerans]|uniref:Uncharacterized protein n=1 Tax=Morganella psychrotolerans TaxID=368603 RepID=A0A5M9QWQ5_9GAMM|nr:hypothetical protein [Morganella psychrotolerans]KAA8712973.1 hypothetical protein F4V73_17805 [Morganella psychrotolerans]OBU01926.1 hypothetical protein AYY16_17105 [Morganella psychrotolerans]
MNSVDFWGLLIGNGAIFTAVAVALKFLNDKNTAKQIDKAISSLHNLSESQIASVIQDNIKIYENRKFVEQQIVTGNIAHMRQAWIIDLRTKSADFLDKSRYCRIILERILRIKVSYRDVFSEEINNEINDLKTKFENSILSIGGISSYIDLLLPFAFKNKEREKDELEAESVREDMLSIAGKLYEIYSLIDEDDELVTRNIEEILQLEISMTEQLKALLYKEWKVTSSLQALKEIYK